MSRSKDRDDVAELAGAIFTAIVAVIAWFLKGDDDGKKKRAK
jgi:hypothetical protein